MKLYKNLMTWPILRLQTLAPRWHRPRRMLSAATGSRGLTSKTLSVSAARDLGYGNISYLESMYRRRWVG